MDSHNLGDLRPRLTDYYIRNYDEIGGAGIVEGDEQYLHPMYPRSLRGNMREIPGPSNLKGGKVQMRQFDKVMEVNDNLTNYLSEMGEHTSRDLLESEPFQMFYDKFSEFQNMIRAGHKGSHMTAMANQLVKLGKQLCRAANQGAGRSGGRRRRGGYSTSMVSNPDSVSNPQGGNATYHMDADEDLMYRDKQSPNYQGSGQFTYGNEMAFTNNQRYMDAMMRDSLDYNRAYVPIRPKEQTYLEHSVRQKAKNIMVDNELYYKPPVTQDILRRVKEREAFLKNMQDQAQQNVKYNVPYPVGMLNPYAKTVNVETGMGRRKRGGSYVGPKGMGRSGGGATGGKPRRANPWIAHLKAYRKAHPGQSLKDAMKGAKASY